MSTPATHLPLSIERIAREVAGPDAARVDAEAAFPSATFDALRQAAALGAAVPRELGGAGAGIPELATACTELARHCASSGMILAMHHIQVLSIARHRGPSRELADYLRRVADEQRLIASATSEVGPSGDMRRSVAAVESRADAIDVTKHATTISYGQHADDLLLTARRSPEAAPSDQVAVLLLHSHFELTRLGRWDTLGMRGTCSPGAVVVGSGHGWQVLPAPFGEIATETMVPCSHILWAGVWLGIATDAFDRAAALLRAKARKDPEAVQGTALELAAVETRLQDLRDVVRAAALEYEAIFDDRAALTSLAFALRINDLKLLASERVVEIVTDAMRLCGIPAYSNDPRTSLGRHLRDAHSAALMINNRRIRETNASLLLVHKGDGSRREMQR